MRVLVLGHSYVRHLRQTGPGWQAINLVNRDGTTVCPEISFDAHPGKDFAYFLEDEARLNSITRVDPDVLVIILGGNSITPNSQSGDLRQLARAFYKKVGELVRPSCIVIAAQVEQRFYSTYDIQHRGRPTCEQYKRMRTHLNNFLNRNLKKAGLIDFVICLGSAGYINNASNFVDGVHLTRPILASYRTTILKSIQYAWLNRS